MGRAKKSKARAKRGSRAPATAKLKANPARAQASAKGKSGDREVERRWKEYWRCRKELEDAVERVRAARVTLNEAMDLERTKRDQFEEIKRTLTDLLDVEPAGPRLLKSVNEPGPDP